MTTTEGCEDQLLRVAQVANVCNVHPETIRRWVVRGALHGIRLPGGGIRIRESKLGELLSHTVTTHAKGQSGGTSSG
jgi:excisionase family DNA binding protein